MNNLTGILFLMDMMDTNTAGTFRGINCNPATNTERFLQLGEDVFGISFPAP